MTFGRPQLEFAAADVLAVLAGTHLLALEDVPSGLLNPLAEGLHVDEDAAGCSNWAARDATGHFEFRRLGSCLHRVEVRGPNHRPVEVDFDLTLRLPGILVELEPARGAG